MVGHDLAKSFCVQSCRAACCNETATVKLHVTLGCGCRSTARLRTDATALARRAL